MNGLLVGELWKHASGALRFQYSQEWMDSEYARALSLSLPLASKVYEGDVIYNFLDNLLPDNDMIRGKMQSRFQTPTTQPFDLLKAVGRDCVGAIQLSSELPQKPMSITATPLLNKDVAELLKGYGINPLGMMNGSDFRISIAGAQEKTALLKMEGKWYLPQGTTPTTHILKLPIGTLIQNGLDLSQSCENEWLCMQITQAYGLPVAQAEVLMFEDQKVLAVQRFDRKWRAGNELVRLPQEDMCQALGIAPAVKYESEGGPSIEQIMHILRGSQNAQLDRENFFKSQILFWLLAAPDGHGKNFSLFIEANNAYRLTPLYDILSAYPLMADKGLQKQKIKMAMALQGKNRHYKWHSFQPRHFITTANKIGYSESLALKHLSDMCRQTNDVIKKVQAQLPQDFPNNIADPIFRGLAQKAEIGLKYIAQGKVYTRDLFGKDSLT